jgi:hypothetical protein
MYKPIKAIRGRSAGSSILQVIGSIETPLVRQELNVFLVINQVCFIKWQMGCT